MAENYDLWSEIVISRLDTLVKVLDVDELLDKLMARKLISTKNWEFFRRPDVTKQDKARELLVDILPRKGHHWKVLGAFIRALRETEGQKHIAEILEGLPLQKGLWYYCARCKEVFSDFPSCLEAEKQRTLEADKQLLASELQASEMLLLGMRLKHETKPQLSGRFQWKKLVESPRLLQRYSSGQIEEINRAIMIAQGHYIFQLADNGRWEESCVGVNVRCLMKCQNEGYILTGNETSQYIVELKNTGKVLAVVPDGHLPFRTSAIGHKENIFLVGGADKLGSTSQVVNCFNSRTYEWTCLPSMIRGRYGCSLTIENNQLFIGGGLHESSAASNVVESFDMRAEKWINLCPTTNKLCELSSLHGQLIATGGLPTQNAVEIYDNETNSWLPLPPMMGNRFGHGSCTTEDNKLYVAGGNTFSNFLEHFQLV